MRLPSIAHWLPGLPFAKSLTIGVMSQLVTSGTNFALGVYFLRELSPLDYGMFALGFAATLFYAGIGSAVFLTQVAVNLVDKPQEDRLRYTGRMALVLAYISVAGLLLLVIVLVTGSRASLDLQQHGPFILSVAAASITGLTKDFFVRHAYNERKELWALRINTVNAVSIFVTLAVLRFAAIDIRTTTAFWSYALAYALATLYAMHLSRLPLARLTFSTVKDDLLQIWSGGKWAAATSILYFLRTQSHTIVVALGLGALGIAKLNAARVFVTPALMLTPALIQVFFPRMVQARADGPERFSRLSKAFTGALLFVALIYSATILSAYSWVSPFITGEKYGPLRWLVAAWAAYACLNAIRNGLETTLVAMKGFRHQFAANAVAAVLALSCVAGFTVSFGLAGAVPGLIVAELALIAVLLRGVRTLASRISTPCVRST